MLCVSQLHLFTVLALFPAFLHAPPLLRSFDFSKSIAAQPPTIVAFLLFQVRTHPCFLASAFFFTALFILFTDDFNAVGSDRGYRDECR